MIKQTDSSNHKIRRYGCLFFALLDIAERATDTDLTDHIDRIYDELVASGAMNKNCYIKDHAAVINAGLGNSGLRARYDGALYVGIDRNSWGSVNDADYLILQGHARGYSGHFFRPEYNPDPTLHIDVLWSVRAYQIVRVA